MIGDMHPAFWLAWIFVIGAFVGSFLNVVVYRLPRNCLSISKPKRSFCPGCKTQLTWKDNIPIIGWALLRGKCRYCGVRFGIRYPLVELLTALLFMFAAWRALYADGNVAHRPESWLILLHLLAMIGVLLPWALIDLDLTYIPDKLTLGPLIVFIPFAAFHPAMQFGLPVTLPVIHLEGMTGEQIDAIAAAPPQPTEQWSHLMFGFLPPWLDSMLSAVAAGLIAAAALWLLGKVANVLFRKRVEEMGGEAMGFGDVKLMVLLGAMLGWPKLLAGFFVAIAVGAVFGVVQLLRKGGHGTPFGPYLAFGALAAALATPWLFAVVDWYQRLLAGG